MTIASAGRRTALGLKRIAQTPATFRNWPSVLGAIASSRVGRGSATLTFHTRGGQHITVPNVRGAFVPTFEVFAEDCYDLAWLLGDLAEEPLHALDIGAHVGTFACWLGAVHPTATIDCFEPAPGTADFLRQNILANGLGDRIAVHQKALAGETGFAVFEEQGAASGLNHLATSEAGDAPGLKVETIAFDEVVASARGPIKLVKMDCEGGEYELVYRSSPSSWASVDRVVLEYHRVPRQSWDELRAWLAGVGLEVQRHHAGSPGVGVAWLSRGPLGGDGAGSASSR